MKIERTSYKGWVVEFVYSPLFEMFCTLHVLYRPEHHKNRQEWAGQMSERMTTKLYKALSFYNDLTYGWDSFMDYLDWDDSENGFDVIKALMYVDQYDDHKFIDMIFRSRLSSEMIDRFVNNRRIPDFDLSPVELAFLEAYDHHRSEIISCLKEYHYLHFHEVQIETESYMIRTLKAHKSLSEHMDLLDYMDMLHPRIEICEDRVSLHKYQRFDIFFNELKTLHVRISTFIDPHLWVNFRSDYLLLCIRAKMIQEENDVHEDLVGMLKALGDRTRLRIIKYLYKKPYSTQELAIHLDISEAGVSKHLKVLYKANVIKKMRKGNYILYFFDQMAIDMIPMNVYQFLDE